jgi:hypothetical protein
LLALQADGTALSSRLPELKLMSVEYWIFVAFIGDR